MMSDSTTEANMLVPGVRVRAATPDDMPTIRAMIRRERLDPTQLHWRHFCVAEDVRSGALVACGQLRPFWRAQELGSLVVEPAWRGRGVGRAMVRHLAMQATRPLFLECAASLAPFYAQSGFTQVAPWRVPFPLNIKFMLSSLVVRLLGGRLAVMAYHAGE